MKKVLLTVLLVFPLTFLSGCAVTTATYSTSSSVYTPAYYPGSPYYGTGIHGGYWGNRGYWGNNYYWRGYRGYYRHGWYGRHW